MYTVVQSKVWDTLGKVDEVTNLIIDEFVAYAVQHGINSPQAETVANTIVTLSSVNVRGKIIARLRKVCRNYFHFIIDVSIFISPKLYIILFVKVIIRTSLKHTKTLTENPAWP